MFSWCILQFDTKDTPFGLKISLRKNFKVLSEEGYTDVNKQFFASLEHDLSEIENFTYRLRGSYSNYSTLHKWLVNGLQFMERDSAVKKYFSLIFEYELQKFETHTIRLKDSNSMYLVWRISTLRKLLTEFLFKQKIYKRGWKCINIFTALIKV